MKKYINSENGYYIVLLFFENIWPLIEKKISRSGEVRNENELFYFSVCNGIDASSEWNLVVKKNIKLNQTSIRDIFLDDLDLFECAIDFCTLYDQRWEGKLRDTLDFLKIMKTNSEKYPEGWLLWNEAKHDVIGNRAQHGYYDWEA